MITNGAFGEHTLTGNRFEKNTQLADIFKQNGYTFSDQGEVFDHTTPLHIFYVPKQKFYSFFGLHIHQVRDKMGQALEVDEIVVNQNTKTIYFLEKKYQEKTGSTDEKIQTGPYKRFYFQQFLQKFQLSDYHIEYAYLLNNWFTHERYQSVFNYLASQHIDCFIDKPSEDYLQKILTR